MYLKPMQTDDRAGYRGLGLMSRIMAWKYLLKFNENPFFSVCATVTRFMIFRVIYSAV